MMSELGSLDDAEFFGLREDVTSESGPRSRQSTPVMTSTPHRRTPGLTSNPSFQRTMSGASKDERTAQAINNLVKGKLLITQAASDGEDDDEVEDLEQEIFGIRSDGRVSTATDYETDLEMDYEEWIAEDNNELPDGASQDRKYVHICNTSGVIPISYFRRNIQKSRFRMRHHGLGPLGAKALTEPLKENHTIERLDLEGNWIGEEGARYVAEMLRDNIYLTDINIAENMLGRSGADAISEVLCKHEFLKALNLSGNDLQDHGALKICDMLQKNTKLKYLYLSHNKFDESAAYNFKEALSHNETLEFLDLSWNHFRSRGAVAIAEGVQENYGLKSLNVSMNGFSDMGAEAMGRALKHNRGLVELDISHNRITETGAGHISLGLQTNDIIKILKIGYNPLGSDGPLALVAAISKNDVSSMNRLDLSDIFVTKDFKPFQYKLESERVFYIIHAGYTLDTDIDQDIRIHDTFRRNPYEKLKAYIKTSGYRLIDLFKDFDKDGSCTISQEEFRQGVEVAGIKITDSEIDMLIRQLDTNNDGMIDFSELVRGDNEFRRLKKEEAQCPDNRLMQDSQNRITRKQSTFLENIIYS